MIFSNSLSRTLVRKRLVLGYHKLGSPEVGALGRSNYIRPGVLARQLETLIRAGSIPCSLDEVAASKPSQFRFAVTFDDGYASVFDQGMEVLRACGVRALVYVVADHVAGSNTWDQQCGDCSLALMSKAQLDSWLAAGHEIGSHTLHHPSLTRLSESDARREIDESRDRLEQQFGVPIRHFCYPYGDWNHRVREWVRCAGYSTAVTCEQRPIVTSDDLFSLPRWMVYTHSVPWAANLLEKLRKLLVATKQKHLTRRESVEAI